MFLKKFFNYKTRFILNFNRDGPRMREILNMHIIKDRLNVEKIKEKNQNLVSTNEE